MPDLRFTVESAACVPFAAVPMLRFGLKVENRPEEQAIHSIALRAQIQIESTRRRYSESEQKKLVDLFGESHRWAQTLRAMLWTHAEATVTAFSGSTTAEIRVPCSFDFNLAATKYFYGLSSGEIPLNFLFSGSCFYAGAGQALEVAPIPWSLESRFRLPVAAWREMMDAYHPNTATLQIRRDLFERLMEYKSRNGIATWDQVLERLLEPAEEAVGAR